MEREPLLEKTESEDGEERNLEPDSDDYACEYGTD